LQNELANEEHSFSDVSAGEDTPLREALNAEEADFVHYMVEAGCDLSSEKYLFDDSSNLSSFDLADAGDLSDSSEDNSLDEAGPQIPFILQDDRRLFRYLKEKATNPRPLFHLCLEAVRAQFRHGNPPFCKMLALPLPDKIKAKLFFRSDV
jgi:hypothetical protein